MNRRTLAAVSTLFVCLASAVPAAEAAFPGRNGLIAFAREGPHGESAIWVVDPRSRHARPLTHVPARCARGRWWGWWDSEPSFSASGRLLVYTHFDDCDPRTPNGVYVMRRDGSGRRLIRRETTWVVPEYPAFSPSGKLIACGDEASGTFVTAVRRPHRERELSLSLERYDSVERPAWGSTGRLAVSLGRGHIATVTPDGKGLRLVTRSARDTMPDWSPSADRIVFQREKLTRRTIKADVLVAGARGKGHRRPRRLTKTRGAYAPIWSPDSRYIAYVRAPDLFSPNGSLWVMRAADGGGQRLVATGVTADRIGWQPRPRRRRR
jgi:Tol biopolymer transport system component